MTLSSTTHQGIAHRTPRLRPVSGSPAAMAIGCKEWDGAIPVAGSLTQPLAGLVPPPLTPPNVTLFIIPYGAGTDEGRTGIARRSIVKSAHVESIQNTPTEHTKS